VGSKEVDCETLAGPFSPEEHESMLYILRSGTVPPKGCEDRDMWDALYSRWKALFPTTLRREAFHEAGHVVVGHSMGWSVKRIDRHGPRAVPYAEVLPPANLIQIRNPISDDSVIRVAGYLAEKRACGWVAPLEAIKVAKDVNSFLAPESRISFVRACESYAFDILKEYWLAVEAIAAMVMESLPVSRKQLLDALRDVEHGGVHRRGIPPPDPF
jgi:hypothetical protein